MKQQSLNLGASAGVYRIDLGHDLASADDREVFSSVLDRIEDVGEVSGSVGGAHLRHGIRLSDSRDHNVNAITQQDHVDDPPWQTPNRHWSRKVS